MKQPHYAPTGDTLTLLREIQKFQSNVIGNKLTVIEVPVKHVAYVTTPNDEALKIYFNAGRYSAGARDTVAVNAYKKYEMIEGGEE